MNTITETVINSGTIQYKIPYYPREKQIELHFNMKKNFVLEIICLLSKKILAKTLFFSRIPCQVIL